MISCEQFISQVSELIEGELDAEWVEAMREHARQCRDCRVVYDTTRSMIRLVGDPGIFELPPEVSQRLHRAIDGKLHGQIVAAGPQVLEGQVAAVPRRGQSSPPSSRWRLLWTNPRLVWAAAAVLLVVAVGVQWANQARTVSVGGWLTDTHCYPFFRSHPQDHPRACMLLAKCQGSGFGLILRQGSFLPFDRAATPRVVAMLEASSAHDHIWVNARGHERHGILDVVSMELRTPDQRRAADHPPRHGQGRRFGMAVFWFAGL